MEGEWYAIWGGYGNRQCNEGRIGESLFSLGLLGLACFYSSRVGFEIGFLYSPYHKLAIKRKLINAVELLYCGEIGSPEYKFLRWRKVSHKRSKTKFETGKSG